MGKFTLEYVGKVLHQGMCAVRDLLKPGDGMKLSVKIRFAHESLRGDGRCHASRIELSNGSPTVLLMRREPDVVASP